MFLEQLKTILRENIVYELLKIQTMSVAVGGS